MTKEQYQWCQDNRGILYNNHSVPRDKKYVLYEIHNALTGLNKKPNGCGKCQSTVINMVKFQLEKYESSNERKEI
tara:strand:- start:988 stop:1212 length:225 start_codon:yes stop_codon:yes gene_type:complete